MCTRGTPRVHTQADALHHRGRRRSADLESRWPGDLRPTLHRRARAPDRRRDQEARGWRRRARPASRIRRARAIHGRRVALVTLRRKRRSVPRGQRRGGCRAHASWGRRRRGLPAKQAILGPRTGRRGRETSRRAGALAGTRTSGRGAAPSGCPRARAMVWGSAGCLEGCVRRGRRSGPDVTRRATAKRARRSVVQ